MHCEVRTLEDIRAPGGNDAEDERRFAPGRPRLHLTIVGMGLTFIELRRFDDAIVAVKKALRQHPSHSTAYRCLASAFAHLDVTRRLARRRLVCLRSIPSLQ